MAKKEHELEELRSDVWGELFGDAKVIADQVFGNVQPDAERQSEAEYDAMLSRLFVTGDRPTLKFLAQQNPRAFVEGAKRLGVQVSPTPVPIAAPPLA